MVIYDDFPIFRRRKERYEFHQISSRRTLNLFWSVAQKDERFCEQNVSIETGLKVSRMRNR